MRVFKLTRPQFCSACTFTRPTKEHPSSSPPHMASRPFSTSGNVRKLSTLSLGRPNGMFPDTYASRYKAWRLIGLHPVCAILFTAGYALREYGAYNYLYSVATKLPLIMFILSQVFIFVCP